MNKSSNPGQQRTRNADPKPGLLPPASGQLIRDIPLIQRYSRHNEAQDNQFRAFFKHHLNLSNEKLDEIVQETTKDVWAQIDCTTCANCCKTLQILVDDDDIQRLATRFALTPRQFSKRYVGMAEDKQKYLDSSPCVFLGDDNRCTVYEDRPKACQDFPYLHKDGFRQRSLTMMSNTEVCPIVFNVWERLKRRLWLKRR